MEYNFVEKNKNKKLIILSSILFCSIILVVGVTTAFFTESNTKQMDSIISRGEASLEYFENKSMMLDNIIPIYTYDLEKAISSKNGLCVDDNGFNVCSVYTFAVKSTYDGEQRINIDMIPTINSFTNLKIMVASVDENMAPTFLTPEPISLEKDNLNAITLIENQIILEGNSNVQKYAILFYIENKGYDQTYEDGNKKFGATIRVDSITTGFNISNNFGYSCYDTELITEGEYKGTYKLTKFNGINHSTGDIVEGCGVTKDLEGFYSVTIPSEVGGNKISTIGGGVFIGVDENPETGKYILNYYSKIINIDISEGIKIIGYDDNVDLSKFENLNDISVFSYVGIKEMGENNQIASFYDVNINIPASLKEIGVLSFSSAGVHNIIFNKNSDNKNNLTKIDGYAFMQSNLNEITIPSNVSLIGENAFATSSVHKLYFEEKSKLETIDLGAFYNCNLEEVSIPYSVKLIGDQAFKKNTSLTKLTFEGSNEERNENNYLTIEKQAFYGCDLTYSGETENDYLVLPARINYIGDYAFGGHGGLSENFNLKFIRYMGSRELLDALGSNWYSTNNTTIKAIDE